MDNQRRSRLANSTGPNRYQIRNSGLYAGGTVDGDSWQPSGRLETGSLRGIEETL